MAKQRNKLAITSLILGCLSALIVPAIFGSLFGRSCMPVSMISFGIAAVGTGAKALSQIGKTQEQGKGLAIAGIVLGGLFSVLALCDMLGLSLTLLGPEIDKLFEQILTSLGTQTP